MNSEKILKQNDGIYSSLEARNIPFDRADITKIDDEDEKIRLLTDENNRLKEAVKANKPPPQAKKEKPPPQPKQEKKKDVDDEDDGDDHNEVKKSFSVIGNMENMKRFFFSNEIEEFKTETKSIEFKYFVANYKYNEDKNGAPEFSAKNLVKGFCKKFDKVTKHFMICFRCFKVGDNYEYKSLWIVNANDELSDVVGDFIEDFEFVAVAAEDIDGFLLDIEKKNTDDDVLFTQDNKTLIDEGYVH